MGSKELGVLTIDKSGADVNSRTCSSDSLKEEGRKFFVNIIFGNIGALLEVGIYSLLVTLEKSLVEGIEKKCERSDTNLYKEGVRDAMANITKKYFKSIVRNAKSQMLGFTGTEVEKIRKFSRSKAL